jgi:PAS domain S-box-containing protein
MQEFNLSSRSGKRIKELPGDYISERLIRLLKEGERLGSENCLTTTAVILLFLGLVAWIDLTTVKGLDFIFFYLFGCCVAGWLAGARAALLCVLVSGLFMFLNDLTGGLSVPALSIFLCNSVVRLGAFALIGWLAARVGKESRDLEYAVIQRTARLQLEVKEHEQTSEMLTEATQLFRQVTENITDVFWVTDPLRREVEYISPGFERLWGRPCQDLYASPSLWIEAVHHDDRERVTRSMYGRQLGAGYDEEYRVVCSDGSLHWVHDRAFPVKTANGIVYRLVGIAEDITERKHAEQFLQAERDIGTALGSTSDLQFALERLLEIALQLEGIDCGGVYLMNARTAELQLEAHCGLSKAFVERVSHYRSDAIEARLAKTGKVTYMSKDQIPRNLEILWGSEGLQALASVPIQHKGTVLGMLNLGSYREEQIPPRTRLGIEMIATQVAGAIARIRAEEAQRRSEAHVRTVINSAPIALVAVDVKGIVTFEDGQALGAMGVKPGEHLDRPATEIYQDFPLMLRNIERARAGESFESMLEFASTVFECRFTPLHDGTRKPAGFIIVATDISERSRLQRQILEISDREQARIGQDIHDGLCQQLIGMGFGLNSLEQSLASEKRPEALAAEKMCKLLDEAINETRQVCRGLYPIRLSTQGLQAALEELAAVAAERYGIHCVCEPVAEPPACDVTTSTHLYRIAQEAVNNAMKHSGARNVSIRLARGSDAVVLEVVDDGNGFSCSPRDGGMGLHIMQYRARLIGGNLHLHPGRNGGTIVLCRMPLTL